MGRESEHLGGEGAHRGTWGASQVELKLQAEIDSLEQAIKIMAKEADRKQAEMNLLRGEIKSLMHRIELDTTMIRELSGD